MRYYLSIQLLSQFIFRLEILALYNHVVIALNISLKNYLIVSVGSLCAVSNLLTSDRCVRTGKNLS